ncbi:MAG: SGNH hydrolase domain-containing protein, partial [Pseudomonadota bacterium]
LWHWPLLVLASSFWARQPDVPEALSILGLSFVVATLSWRFIETPVRKRAVFATRPSIYRAAGAGVAAVAVAGAALWVSQGWPQRYPQPMRTFALASYDISPFRDACTNRSPSVVRNGSVCVIGAPNVTPSFAVVGDSFADALAPGLDAAARERGVAGLLLIQTGCLPLFGVKAGAPCDTFLAAAESRLRESPNLHNIVLIARWSGFVGASRFGAIRRSGGLLRDADTKAPSVEENQRVVQRGFQRTLAALPERQIYVVAYLPEQAVLVPQAATTRALMGQDPSPGVPRALFDRRQMRVREILEAPALAALHVIDASASLCTARDCPIVVDGVPYYFDDNHISRTAAIRIRAMFAPALGGAVYERVAEVR